MLEKIVKFLGWGIIGISAIIGIHFFVVDAGPLEDALETMKNMSSDMKILEVEKTADSWGGLVLNASIFLFIACAVFAVGFAIYKFVVDTIENPKSAIKPVIVLIVAALLVVVSYSMASETIPVFLKADNSEITATTSKWVETSLFGMYILFGITILALIYTEVSRIWR